MKRITFLKKDYLERGLKGYFKEVSDVYILVDSTDNKIKKRLDELNKNAKTRFYEIDGDFKLNTDKGVQEFIIFIARNYKKNERYNHIYRTVIINGLALQYFEKYRGE